MSGKRWHGEVKSTVVPASCVDTRNLRVVQRWERPKCDIPNDSGLPGGLVPSRIVARVPRGVDAGVILQVLANGILVQRLRSLESFHQGDDHVIARGGINREEIILFLVVLDELICQRRVIYVRCPCGGDNLILCPPDAIIPVEWRLPFHIDAHRYRRYIAVLHGFAER